LDLRFFKLLLSAVIPAGSLVFAVAADVGCADLLATASQAAAFTPSSAPSAEPPVKGQSGTAIVASYVDSEACVGCHQASAHDFGTTMMGNILIKHPRDDIEKRGCESCHGPGSRYVPPMAKAMGEGKKPDEAMRGPPVEPSLTTFRPDSGESAKQTNAPA
jgi:hypothetical protein